MCATNQWRKRNAVVSLLHVGRVAYAFAISMWTVEWWLPATSNSIRTACERLISDKHSVKLPSPLRKLTAKQAFLRRPRLLPWHNGQRRAPPRTRSFQMEMEFAGLHRHENGEQRTVIMQIFTHSAFGKTGASLISRVTFRANDCWLNDKSKAFLKLLSSRHKFIQKKTNKCWQFFPPTGTDRSTLFTVSVPQAQRPV